MVNLYILKNYDDFQLHEVIIFSILTSKNILHYLQKIVYELQIYTFYST